MRSTSTCVGQREAAEEACRGRARRDGTARRARRPSGRVALQRQLAVVKADLDVVPLQPGQFRGEDVGVGGLVEIDRRRPAGALVARRAVHALLEREQIAQRIPAREGHERNRSTYRPEFEGAAGPVATIRRF